MTNPFPRITAEVRRDPSNKRLLDEIGAYLTSLAYIEPKRKDYDFYEYIGESNEKEGDE